MTAPSRDQLKRFMLHPTTLVSGLIIAACIMSAVGTAIHSSLPPSSSQSPARAAPAALNASVSANRNQLILQNTSSENWGDIEILISERNSLASAYKTTHAGWLYSNQKLTIDLSDFADADGRRFNPFALKLRSAQISAWYGGQKHVSQYVF